MTQESSLWGWANLQRVLKAASLKLAMLSINKTTLSLQPLDAKACQTCVHSLHNLQVLFKVEMIDWRMWGGHLQTDLKVRPTLIGDKLYHSRSKPQQFVCLSAAGMWRISSLAFVKTGGKTNLTRLVSFRIPLRSWRLNPVTDQTASVCGEVKWQSNLQKHWVKGAVSSLKRPVEEKKMADNLTAVTLPRIFCKELSLVDN